jgi:O-antigen/teichoic acid export membrane protein
MNSIIQVFSFDMISKIMLGLLGIILIRYMPRGEYAQYTLALALITAITQTFSSSFNRIYIVGYENLGLAASSLPFLGFQLVALTLLTAVTFPFRSSFPGTYWLITAAVFAGCLAEFSKTAFQQELKFIRLSMIELLRSLLFFATILFLITFYSNKLTARQVLLVQAAALFVVFLLAFRKRLQIRELARLKEAVSIARSVANGNYKFLFGYFFLLAFLAQTDIFMLKIFGNNFAVASFGSAFRYYSLIMLSLNAVHSVLLPLIQKADSLSELEMIMRRLNKMLLVFAPTVLSGAWLSKWIIPLIDKGKYPDAVTISFLFSPYVNIVMRCEDFKFLFVLIVVAFLLSIGLNAALIPALSGAGAAVATLVSFGLVNGMTYFRARKLIKVVYNSET